MPSSPNHQPTGLQFHSHVYFTEDSKQQALELREKLIQDLKSKLNYLGPLNDRKVGPHPLPMFEFHFGLESLSEIIVWLMEGRNGLNVLIHQMTGDDPKDHYQGALWLGQSLPLDDSKLDPSPSRN